MTETTTVDSTTYESGALSQQLAGKRLSSVATARTTGLWVLAGAFATAVLLAPAIAPFPPDEQLGILTLKSIAPSLEYPFGTDAFSRDLLSRVLYGARLSLVFSLAAVAIGLAVGTSFGAVTSLGPRWLSVILRRLVDVALSIPRLLILLAVTAFAGPFSIAGLVLLVALTGWFAIARQVTDELDALKTREFVQAARATGVRTARLFLLHLLPHLGPLLAVAGTLALAGTIALEAGLSFLGLGIQPPTASLGTILHDASGVMGAEWWIVVFPGIATVVIVLVCNALGDALRERFTPFHVAVTLYPAAITPETRLDGRTTGQTPAGRQTPLPLKQPFK